MKKLFAKAAVALCGAVTGAVVFSAAASRVFSGDAISQTFGPPSMDPVPLAAFAGAIVGGFALSRIVKAAYNNG